VSWGSQAGHVSCVGCRAAWRPPARPGDTRAPRGVGRVWDGRALSGVHALPAPLAADRCWSLFEACLGTITWSDAAETGMEAVRPCAFASRSVGLVLADLAAVSRCSCRKLLNVPGVLDDVGSTEDSRGRPQPCGLPLQSRRGGTPLAAFRRASARPADAPLHAAMGTSRRPPQDLGPGWLARPFLGDSCIPDFLPVYPGAPTLSILDSPRPAR
jgi:hypothetical protein